MPCSPTCTTNGKPATAATSPTPPWPSSTPSAILKSSPNSTPATDTEDHLEVHHPVGRSHESATANACPYKADVGGSSPSAPTATRGGASSGLGGHLS